MDTKQTIIPALRILDEEQAIEMFVAGSIRNHIVFTEIIE